MINVFGERGQLTAVYPSSYHRFTASYEFYVTFGNRYKRQTN